MALLLSEVLGDIANQSYSMKMLVRLKIKEGKIQEAISYYFSGIRQNGRKCAVTSATTMNLYKISFSDKSILTEISVYCFVQSGILLNVFMFQSNREPGLWQI